MTFSATKRLQRRPQHILQEDGNSDEHVGQIKHGNIERKMSTRTWRIIKLTVRVHLPSIAEKYANINLTYRSFSCPTTQSTSHENQAPLRYELKIDAECPFSMPTTHRASLETSCRLVNLRKEVAMTYNFPISEGTLCSGGNRHQHKLLRK